MPLDTAQPQNLVSHAGKPCEGLGWGCVDGHIRWAQLLLYLWFNPWRGRIPRNPICCKHPFPRRKEIILAFCTPSYTWSPSLLTHHPTRNACSKSSTCPKTACLDKKNLKSESSKAGSHPIKCSFCYSGSLQANHRLHAWLSWFVHCETSDSAGDFIPSHQPALLHGAADTTNISSPFRRLPKTALYMSAQCSKTKHFFSGKKKKNTFPSGNWNIVYKTYINSTF